ncbi:reverse transcriptase domain-containing protein [Sphingomonas citri]
MIDWSPRLKHYPHFDQPIKPEKIYELVRDPAAVASNAFYPFLRFEESWQPFRARSSGKPPKKVRQLRFASRRDAYIFSYYRHLLVEPYERALKRRGLSDAVIAYRKLKSAEGRGKSNIEFAFDAFSAIRRLEAAAVVTLDISSFFESLDHATLKEKWCALLGVDKLPRDHAAVFKAITKYSVVDRDAAYERLGYLTYAKKGDSKIPTYVKNIKDMPRQLCSSKEFREKIAGKGGTHKSLIERNRDAFGIPQGSPISDILANLYLIDFDSAVSEYVSGIGGVYYRYSDDVILILPGSDFEALQARNFAVAEIKRHGPKLEIKQSKTSVMLYTKLGGDQKFLQIDGSQGKNGLEYLGFRYDGHHVYLRDSTLSRLYRKVKRSARMEARSLASRYPNRDVDFVKSKYDAGRFLQRYGRVADFDSSAEYTDWTFWTYAKRAIRTFGSLGSPIGSQLRNYSLVSRQAVASEIDRIIDL